MFAAWLVLWLAVVFTGAKPDPAISEAAQGRADRQEFYHSMVGYPPACGWGEVLASGTSDAVVAFTLWLASPAHNGVITRPWDRVGVGHRDGLTVLAFENDC